MAERYMAIAETMNGGFSDFKPFPHQFYVTMDPQGVRSVLGVSDEGVVRPVSEDLVTDSIMSYCAHELASVEGYRFDQGTAKKCMLYWKGTTEPIEEPALLREKSDPGLCYRRLPFDFIADPNLCPRMGELLGRCSNADALQIFIGSLFFEQANRHQYVWLWGAGGDGKSSFLSVLTKIMGNQYHAEDANSSTSKFWLSSFVNKRLVGFPDCNNYALPLSGLFKSITGDDLVRVERKHKDATSTRLRCKIIVLSNQPPQLSGSASDLRRAIICEVQPLRVEVDPDYQEKLWQEAPYFIGCCKARYLEACGKHGPIPADMAEAVLLASESEEVYEQVFTAHFARCGFNHEEYRGVPAHVVHMKMQMEKLVSTHDQRGFKLYIKRKYGVRYRRLNNGGYYYGLRMLTPTEQSDAKRVFLTKEDVEKIATVHCIENRQHGKLDS